MTSATAYSGERDLGPIVRVQFMEPASASDPLPSYAVAGDAGADLCSVEDLVLAPGERALVHTGVAIELPPGYAGFVHPRSGLAARHGVSIVNAPGTIDSGYRGEVLVNLINLDPRTPVTVRRGDRVAQLIVQRVEHCTFVQVDKLTDSARADAGHGSTGGFADSPAGHSTEHQ